MDNIHNSKSLLVQRKTTGSAFRLTSFQNSKYPCILTMTPDLWAELFNACSIYLKFIWTDILKHSCIFTAANEVCQGYVFTSVCQSFCSWGVSASVHAGIHPLGADTPWEHTPPEQTPRSRHPQSRHPPAQCMLGNTGNQRAIRILLECILVLIKHLSFVLIP